MKPQIATAKNLDTAGIIELNNLEIDYISGGHPAAIAAAALVTLGNSALNFGRNLGATAYRILH